MTGSLSAPGPPERKHHIGWTLPGRTCSALWLFGICWFWGPLLMIPEPSNVPLKNVHCKFVTETWLGPKRTNFHKTHGFSRIHDFSDFHWDDSHPKHPKAILASPDLPYGFVEAGFVMFYVCFCASGTCPSWYQTPWMPEHTGVPWRWWKRSLHKTRPGMNSNMFKKSSNYILEWEIFDG